MFKFSVQPIRLSQAIVESLKLYRASFWQLWYWGAITSLVSHISRNIFPIYSLERGFSILGLIVLLASLLFNVFIFIVMIHRAQSVGIQQRVSLIDSFKLASEKYLRSLIAFIIVTIWVILTSFAFIIPGVYFLIALICYLPAIVIDNAGIFESMKQSLILVHKNWFRSFVLFLIPFVISVVLLILLDLISQAQWFMLVLSIILGLIFAPYYTSTLLVLYNDLKLRHALKPSEENPPSRRK